MVNPLRSDCLYPEKGLCGTGLAFKVSELVARRMGRGLDDLHALLDLVAVATVADLVPLQGENRVLVRSGLRRFAVSHVAGLTALLEVAGLDARSLDAGHLGFAVAPRINAAGRIGESADALALLLTNDREEAGRLARKLDEVNRERQEEDRRTLEEALDALSLEFDAERDFGVVLAREGWHPGVIGIVASRVVERIHRPTVLVALDGNRGRGSARSIPGFHLYDALAACRSHMGRFGGHRQAAGMDVDRDAVAALRVAFNAEARRRLRPDDLQPVLRADAELALEDASLDLVHWLGYLEPHGMGNPRPLFLARSVFLERPRTVGKAHLKVTMRSGTARLDGIGFGLAALDPPDSLGSGPYDVLLKLEGNDWQGVRRAQARIVAFRPGATRGG
jgi:single-stranded-DNA-specific exonuclease